MYTWEPHVCQGSKFEEVDVEPLESLCMIACVRYPFEASRYN